MIAAGTSGAAHVDIFSPAYQPAENAISKDSQVAIGKQQEQSPQNHTEDHSVGWRAIGNPIVIIALMILSGTFALIGAAMLNMDSGVLGRMSESEFARGLITYLFAVVTIGTAIVLVVYSLTAPISDPDNKRFERGKDVLSLLLGVFGTIVGFYFGSELADTTEGAADGIILTAPLLGTTELMPGQKTTVSASVSGGTPPYKFSIVLGIDIDAGYTGKAARNGWILTEIAAPTVISNSVVVLNMRVEDSAGRVAIAKQELRVNVASP